MIVYRKYIKSITNYYIVLLVLMLNCFQCYSQRIEECLSLKVSVEVDTVCYGDSVQLNVLFENITNEEYLFYPKARFVLEKSYQRKFFGAEYDKPYIINDTIDLRITQNILPDSIYEMNFKVYVNSKYFVKGENVLYLCYLFRPLLSAGFKRKYLEQKYLSGVLRSNIFMIYVK